ncbi:MAG: hypothetical protein HQK58_09835 [Deltaproteobacteria bacterium]|nr:hypothetical protein [Deltaproteobacteria bacterium]
MKKINEQLRKVEAALLAAHRREDEAQINQEWQAEVMFHIRRLRPVRGVVEETAIFDRLLWRFAAAAGLTAAAVCLYFLFTGSGLETDIEKLKLIWDPVGFLAAQALIS